MKISTSAVATKPKKMKKKKVTTRSRNAKSNMLQNYNSAEVLYAKSEKDLFCNIFKNCGHQCDGLKGEPVCLPCLYPECAPVSMAVEPT